MHIHDLNPKRTAIALVLFAVVIVIGLLTVNQPRLKYVQPLDQTLEMVAWEEGTVFPYEIVDVLNGSIDTIMLIDIRNTFDYSRGHIPGSENITSVDLVNEENIERLEQLMEDGMTVVVYGKTQLDANGPWLLLRQLGFDNVRILLGGYSYYKEWEDMLGDSYADDSYFMGGADHDYNEVASNAAMMEEESEAGKTAVTFTRKKKKAVAEGGC